VDLYSMLWTPRRAIQGQAKNGLKVAGVTDLRGKYIEGFPSCYLDS